MILRDLGLFLEFMIKIQPLLFLIISVFAVYLSFKMLSNAKASRAHEERIKLVEVKMNIKSLFSASMDNLTEIYNQHNILYMKLKTYYPNFGSEYLAQQKRMLEASKKQLEEVENIYKNYIENVEKSITLESSIKFLLELQGNYIVSPRNKVSNEKYFNDLLERAANTKELVTNSTKCRFRDKCDFHN